MQPIRRTIRTAVIVCVGLTLCADIAFGQIIYDFSADAGVNHFAYGVSIPRSPNPPTVNTIPTTEFLASEYTAISLSDDSRHNTGVFGGQNRAAVRYTFTIAEDPAAITNIEVHFEGGDTLGGSVGIYLWNATTLAYEVVGTIAVVTPPDVVVIGNFAANPANYVDISGVITVFVVNSGGNKDVDTDYVKVTITGPQCAIGADCDDLNPCTDNVCTVGVCSNPNNTAVCDDGSACTVGDVCSGGVCTSGAAPDCSGAGDQCNTASCDLAGLEGNCDTLTPVLDGTTCDDGAACNIGETCQAGVCTGGAAPNCSAAGDQCNTASCDALGLEGNCDTLTPVINGTTCDDGDACTVSDSCSGGFCQSGVAPDCSGAGDQCNDASCDLAGLEGNCDTLIPVLDGTICDDGAACNVGETCQSGVCTGGAAPDCAAFGDQCNTASCDAVGLEGNCDTLTPVLDGTTCDDAAACNVGETCQTGVCSGGAGPDCSAAGDQCNTASCDAIGLEGNCDTLTPVLDGTACDDGVACNTGDTCQLGVCSGGASPDCSGAGDQCNTASCDVAGADGNCDTLTPVIDGTTCNDGLFCTVTDTCTTGVCGGTGDPCPGLNCNETTDVCFQCILDIGCDDGNSCTLDTCTAGFCVNSATNEGLACNDGNACNTGETCQTGVCTGGVAPNCSAAGDQCNNASCDSLGLEGNCDTLTPVLDGTTCNDANTCNIGETCQLGVCTGGAATDCSAAGDQCNNASCDAAGLEGNCDTLTPVLDGTTCSDANSCNIGETCQLGVCTGGAAQDCSGAGDQCNDASCDAAGIEGNCDTLTLVLDGTICDDANACNTGESCQVGVCTGGTAPDCSAAGDQCNTAACDISGLEGNCDTLTPVLDGTTCDDANTCNIGESCQLGVCTGGASPDCSAAGDQCNTASCDVVGLEGNCDTLTPVLDGTTCDDANACNTGESCQLGVCTGGAAPDCSGAGDQCNTASCDAAGLEGNCDTITPVLDGTSCDDGVACNVGELCQLGVCTGGAAQDCSGAGDQCNTASCDAAGAEGNCATFTPVLDGTSCDDGNVCNTAESCQLGVCTGGAATDCSAAGDQCNDASCDALGLEGNCDTITPVLDGTSCDDGAACNINETCQLGVCTGGAAPDCSGVGDQCNDASCDALGLEGNCDTLTPVLDGTTCDDTNACNINEKCQLGVCTGSAAPDCSAAGDQCNTASCDAVGLEGNCDTLTPILDGTTCDDANACNVGESCQLGVCTGGAGPNCSTAGDQCNTASCDTLGIEGNCDTLTPVLDGTICDDGAACNINETCQLGVCTSGAPPDCSGAGDQCNDASCDIAGLEGNCDIITPVLDGTICDDGLFCTLTDTCTTGVCGGTGDSCVGQVCDETNDVCAECLFDIDCDDLNPCTDDVCSLGVCQNNNNVASCDDGDACTVGDVCSGGTCLSGSAPDCSGAGDQCNAASCDSLGLEGNCDLFTPVLDGTTCDDANSCNIGESCQLGVCTGGLSPDCSGAGDQCNDASCDALGLEGNCDTFTPVLDGTTCDDGNACNEGESCQLGVCTGGTAPNCTAFGDQCNDASCDAAGLEGNCDTLTPVLDGTTCDDGNACNTGESCQLGLCTGGAAPDCSLAGDQCNDASCDALGLEGNCDTFTPVLDGTTCDDGNACNAGESCQLGVCSGGAAPDCSAAGDQCNTASCDTLGLEGNCDTLTPVLDGTTCDDGNACNTGESCQLGVCTGGAAPDCSAAGDQCNTASCDTLGLEGNCDTLTPVLDGTACNDANTCNVGESCQLGVCSGGLTPDCSLAGDQCNTASCDTLGLEGNCDTLTPILDGTVCDDGNACNVGESCQLGVCTGGALPDCTAASDQCNAASCDGAGLEGNCDIITPVLDGTTCDDGLACTDATCQIGVCTFANHTGQVTIDIEVEAVNNAITRDVTFAVTTCGVGVDTRVIPVTIDSFGLAVAGNAVVLNNVDANASWINVREGHTLRKLAPLSFTSCSATVDLTGASRLISGDFQTAVAVSQDNLVDITDFSILAINFNKIVDASFSIGADVTADGIQGTADFTVLQVNFLKVGDTFDSCPVGASESDFTVNIGLSGIDLNTNLVRQAVHPRSSILVNELQNRQSGQADFNDDGIIDARDVRAFATRYNLTLLPDFNRQLLRLEGKKPLSRRGDLRQFND